MKEIIEVSDSATIDACYNGFMVDVKIQIDKDEVECSCYLYSNDKIVSKSGYKYEDRHVFYIKNQQYNNLRIKIFFRYKNKPSVKVSKIFKVSNSESVRYYFPKDTSGSPYFIGATRFSLYNPNGAGWRLSSSSESEYLETLYSNQRLQVRFDIFINKALPLYEKMAKKYYYKHFVHYSSAMPEYWKNKLKTETEKYNFIILVESDKILRPLPIKELLSGQDSRTLVYFRVDDDDLLSVKYLDYLSQYSQKEYEGMIVSFGNGLIAKYDDNEFIEFRECHRRFLGLGMARIGRYDASKGDYWLPKTDNHERIDKTTPTIIDSREVVFVWTQHLSQDTRVGRKNPSSFTQKIMDEYKILDNLKEYIDIFPTLSSEFENIYSLSNKKL